MAAEGHRARRADMSMFRAQKFSEFETVRFQRYGTNFPREDGTPS